ncbi:MAG: hypothetical protein F6J87_21405 [Spirulina sp. SIO3F2]|nr:hypothetical protein [Spirulina sp. SIO3F2]
MSGGIYLIQGNDQLVAMTEKPYDSESLLQELLERYPNLLGVTPAVPETSLNWLVVRRTGSIPTEDVGIERWSLNYLFLDQQAIPTLVEVQHEGEPRPRQEIIGQMLDYAANAGVYWPVESIVDQFEVNCRRQNRDPEQVFADFLGSEANEEKFWQQVKTNLQAGKIRLMFVADHIPAEMQRVVEFLNKQMDPAEVLAVEIKQYISPENGLKTLVSNVIGQTAEALQKKASTYRGRRQWDESSFLAAYVARFGEDETELIKKLYDWIENCTDKVAIHWGTGDRYGGFSARLRNPSPLPDLFFVGIDGNLQIDSRLYAETRPFNHEGGWLELRNRLSEIGLALPINPQEPRFPKMQLFTVPDVEALEPTLDMFEWVLSRLAD